MIVKKYAQNITEVVLDDARVSLEEYVAVVRYHAKVEFTEAYRKRIADNRAALEKRLNAEAVYGINTGFGDNVRYRISEADMVKLQENILLSHSCAIGQPLPKENVRALMMYLLVNMGMGHSGVRVDVVEQVRLFLNEDIYPYVASEGGNGGLARQAYMAMTLFGMGRLIVDGKAEPTANVLARKGIAPLSIKPREGLAALNDCGSVSIALLAIYDFIIAMRHADICGALTFEALRSTDKAYDPRLLELKGDKGAVETAAYLLKLLSGSKIMERARTDRLQDSTNMRIIPHVHAVAKRICRQSYEAVMEDFYGVMDNPVFFDDGSALMGANWDSTKTTLYCDALAIAAVDVAKLMEAHVERMIDPKLSGLPAFLVKNPGLNSGFMIVQYVTAGLWQDMTLLANPVSSFNCGVSAGQENPSYYDESAAFKLYDSVRKLRHIITLTMMTALQALDFRTDEMSAVTQRLYCEARKTVSFMDEDDAMYARIEAMETLVASNKLLDIAQELAGDFTL